MKANIGLKDQAREKVAGELNELLAEEFSLYIKARNYHWNVEGPDFGELHKFFEDQYEAQDETIDEVAERARALGHKATGLKDAGEKLSAKEMLASLLASHEALCRSLRGRIKLAQESGDDGTADFLTGLLEGHEKSAWMLRAYLG